MTNTEIIYKIYKITSKNDEEAKISFYSYTKNSINNILKNYYSQYKNYLKDKENKLFNNVYLLYEKYNIDDLELLQIDECNKDELKDKLYNLIKNDKSSVNKKFSINEEELKINQINSSSNWKIDNLNKISNYNKQYYQANLDKAREYYNKSKEKVYEKKLCDCGKYYLHNRKANTVIHNNTKHHLNYINSLNN